MRLLVAIEEHASLGRYLAGVGETTEAPQAAGRAPMPQARRAWRREIKA